mmetsp:Transcript_5455/g.7285  ORF Transcript_5455/g.7285 Transcript_5455/m.7285 type:complete len:199 (+) Transcript_5455:557-1153(+)
MSEKVQKNNSTCIEAIFFCIPAHLFNRMIILVPMGICVIMGALNYDYMLATNSYQQAGNKIDDEQRLAYGFCFFALYGLTLLFMVCCTQLMKYGIKRERPKRRSDTTRISDLRGKEAGTFAMPSGDSAAGAVFCALVAIEMGMPQIYLLLPFVMLGRVYYQCHWIGDTIVGVMVGTFWGVVSASNFHSFVPFFQQVTG